MEFVGGLEVMMRGSPDEKANFIFEMFDMANDGMLNREELRYAYQEMRYVNYRFNVFIY
jgi:Ca2+-binding EF-hand superfamily protein